MQILVSILMPSRHDWEIIQHTELTLGALGIPREVKILCPHRTPDQVVAYAKTAESRGIELIITSGYDSAQLPGLVAANTILPVLGIPLANETLHGIDALLSMTQMPRGFPVATFAIGKTGAINAALFAAQILGLKYSHIANALKEYRAGMTKKILDYPHPEQ